MTGKKAHRSYKNEYIRHDESEQSQENLLGKPKNFKIGACYESLKTNDGMTALGRPTTVAKRPIAAF